MSQEVRFKIPGRFHDNLGYRVLPFYEGKVNLDDQALAVIKDINQRLIRYGVRSTNVIQPEIGIFSDEEYLGMPASYEELKALAESPQVSLYKLRILRRQLYRMSELFKPADIHLNSMSGIVHPALVIIETAIQHLLSDAYDKKRELEEAQTQGDA